MNKFYKYQWSTFIISGVFKTNASFWVWFGSRSGVTQMRKRSSSSSSNSNSSSLGITNGFLGNIFGSIPTTNGVLPGVLFGSQPALGYVQVFVGKVGVSGPGNIYVGG